MNNNTIINNINIDKEIVELRERINVLRKQRIITEETYMLLQNQIQEITAYKNKIESDYSFMLDLIEFYEKAQKDRLSWLRAVAHEDSARGQFARETVYNITDKKETK